MAFSSLDLEAVDDFDRLCSVLGTSSLTRQQFVDILQGFGLPEDESNYAQLFDRLCLMCREAEAVCMEAKTSFSPSKALKAGQLDSDAIRCLYANHPSYTTCGNPMTTSIALTDYIKGVFEKSMRSESLSLDPSTKQPILDRSELIAFLRNLSNSSLPNDSFNEEKKGDDDVSEASFEQVIGDIDDNQRFGLEDIASAILRYESPSFASEKKMTNAKDIFSGKLPAKLFDPFHTSPENFVAAMDAAVLDHDALKHHMLTSLSTGSWGGLGGTLRRLSDFMLAYRHFTSTFCTHLEATIKMVGEVDSTGNHAEILEENMEEEQGIYHDEDIEMIELLGLDAEKLANIPHKQLYLQCFMNLRYASDAINSSKCPKMSEAQCRHIAQPLVDAFENACNSSKGATAATAISAMYFGSELIVAKMYSKLSSYLLALVEKDDQCPLSKQDLAFFILHIDMDVYHADKMREIVVSLSNDEATRLQIASVTDAILTARVEFFDRFVEAAFPPTGHGGEDSAKLYNNQSQNWVRKGATCLSDFTGRPVVFDMCSPFVSGAHVLDVGCGEGYGSRNLVEMGAERIIGLDVSKEMIAKANANPMKSNRELYVTCDAEKITEKLSEIPASLGMLPGRMLKDGCFDLAIAIFLFNYTSLSKMKSIISQVYQTLKPGGHFIFSVPHPAMLNAHGGKGSEVGRFVFYKGVVQSDSYFSIRDRKFSGIIRTLDGRNLNVKMLFKTISDYNETLKSVGFDISNFHECRVLPEHVSHNPEFFSSVKDSPLHIVFDVAKPISCDQIGRIPKAITWTPFEKANPDRVLTAVLPAKVSDELIDFAIEAHNNGATEDTYSPTHEDYKRLSNVAWFASDLRNKLINETGAVHVKGLDMEKLAGGTDRVVGRAKLAYFVLSSLIGKVDGSARGRLFDVVDKGLDTNADNVLFSVSRAAAPYHTDGASVNKSYDAVGLLCINPASEGGKLQLSNAGTALANLKAKLPKFILNELFRPLPRDILENGSGQGVNGKDLLQFSRSPELLKLRVRHNAYPIFEDGRKGRTELVRFRYMRQWIETGHTKGQLTISPLLRIALDALDSALESEQIASIMMQPGEMIFCNNTAFAHARGAFTNKPGMPERHNVRVWINLHGCQ